MHTLNYVSLFPGDLPIFADYLDRGSIMTLCSQILVIQS